MSSAANPSDRTPGGPVVGVEGDQPIVRNADDRLGFGVYADAISRLIQHPETGTPFVLAINARWGAGKSSLANLIEARLTRQREKEGEKPYVVCHFNAWMHDDADNLRTAFSATVAKEADKARPYWRRLWQPLPISLLSPKERVKVYGPLYVGGVLLLLGALGLAARNPRAQTFVATLLGNVELSSGAKTTALTATIGLLVGYLPKLRAVGSAVASFVRHPADAANKGTVAAARAQLGELIAQAVGRWGGRFVVFVDDVERCRPPKPIEVLEAVNQLLDHPGVVVVLLGDMAAVAANAGLKYQELAKVYSPDRAEAMEATEAVRLYGHRYLQKIVQLQFDIPSDTPITAARLDGLEATGDYAFEDEIETPRRPEGIAGWIAAARGSLSVGKHPLVRGAFYFVATAQLLGPMLATPSNPSQPPEATKMSLALAASGLSVTFVRIGHRRWPQAASLSFWWSALVRVTRFVVPAPFFYLEQTRFPRQAVFAEWRRSMVGCDVAQALLALLTPITILSLALSGQLARQAYGLYREARADVGYEPWTDQMMWSDVRDGLIAAGSWLGWIMASQAVRRAFESRVQQALQEWVGRVADRPDAAWMSAAQVRERLMEEILADGRLKPSQRRRLDASLARAGDLFAATFRRRSQEARLGTDADAVRAFDYAVPFLPPLPRNAKRLRNAVRVLIYVLNVQGARGVAPESVGKWAALREGWPDVAERLMRTTALLERLEPAGVPAVPDMTQELATYADDERLIALLREPYPITPMVRRVSRLALRSP